MKTVAQHIDQLRQFVLEHPTLSNTPLAVDVEIVYDKIADRVIVRETRGRDQ